MGPLDEGDIHAFKGEWRPALTETEMAIADDRNNPRAYANAGLYKMNLAAARTGSPTSKRRFVWTRIPAMRRFGRAAFVTSEPIWVSGKGDRTMREGGRGQSCR